MASHGLPRLLTREEVVLAGRYAFNGHFIYSPTQREFYHQGDPAVWMNVSEVPERGWRHPYFCSCYYHCDRCVM